MLASWHHTMLHILVDCTPGARSLSIERVPCLQNPATLPIIVLRAESDELATVRTELTGGKKFYAVATHLDLYDPEVWLSAPTSSAGVKCGACCLPLHIKELRLSMPHSIAVL